MVFNSDRSTSETDPQTLVKTAEMYQILASVGQADRSFILI